MIYLQCIGMLLLLIVSLAMHATSPWLPKREPYNMLQYSSIELKRLRPDMSLQQPRLPCHVYQRASIWVLQKVIEVHRGCRGRQKGKKMSKYQEKNCPVAQTLSYNSTMMTNLALINCQSACNKADVIKHHLIDHDIELLALTETWFKTQHDQRTSDITPSGYKLVHTPRTGRKGGGVALLYMCGLMLSVLKLTDEQPSSFEYIMADFTHSARHVRVIVLYRPPSSQKRRAPFSDFIREFSIGFLQ